MQPFAYAGFEEGVAAYQKGDYSTAFKEFKPLADQGDARAQDLLGDMYELGMGVTQDYVQAHMWFNIASANGNANARKNRDIVANKMSPKQLEQAQKLASDWMQQHGN
jgi:hypothetical protein